jgi:ATP-dependent DNA ligase
LFLVGSSFGSGSQDLISYSFASAVYLARHAQLPPCIPSRGTKVPDRPEWIHEIKHDGYRLIVQRDGKRVRLWTRNGHDWSERYPLIVEAALRNRNSSFVIDGEAVLLGVDRISIEAAFYSFGCVLSLIS